MAAVGVAVTVTAFDAVAEQLPLVTVTVYVPLLVKVFAAVLGELPPDQLYVPPPVAVRDTDPQPEAEPVIPAVGVAVTVTALDVVTVQLPDVTETV